MNDLTYASICWLRYKKGCDLVGTEIGSSYLMDACGVKLDNDGNIFQAIEIEVKISVSDLRADFANKQKKHANYAEGKRCPNYLYFVVHPDIAEFAKEFIPKQNKNYGIMTFDPEYMLREHYPWGFAKSLTSIHRCKALTTELPKVVSITSILRRVTNEYFMQRYVIQNHGKNVLNRIEHFINDFDNKLPVT